MTKIRPAVKRWGIVVGVDEYVSAGEYLHNLKGCVADARRMYDVMVDKDYKQNTKEWHATITDAGKIIATRMLSGKCKQFALCDADDAWYGVKRIDGFFDNSPRELIVAVGYWGGGNCTFAYVDEENTDTSEPADAIAQAISESTGLELNCVIFLKEDKEDE